MSDIGETLIPQHYLLASNPTDPSVSFRFIRNKTGTTPEKLADVELHFGPGLLRADDPPGGGRQEHVA
jgi:hypothetical protein